MDHPPHRSPTGRVGPRPCSPGSTPPSP